MRRFSVLFYKNFLYQYNYNHQVHIKAITAMVLTASFAFPTAAGYYEPPGMPTAAYSGSQYNVEHTEFRVQSAAFDTVLQYVRDGVAAFDDITPDTPQYVDAIHPFVLNATHAEIRGRCVRPARIWRV